jgi:hypothetical protein
VSDNITFLPETEEAAAPPRTAMKAPLLMVEAYHLATGRPVRNGGNLRLANPGLAD